MDRVADNYDDIRQRMAEIRRTEGVCDKSCPMTSRAVADCLRTSTQCPTTCAYRDLWVGPEGGS